MPMSNRVKGAAGAGGIALIAVAWTWLGASTSQEGTPSVQLPGDVKAENPIGNYTEYNHFAWEQFIALNSALNATENSSTTQTDGQASDNSTLWERWMEDYQILVQTGEKPAAWGTSREMPAACAAVGAGVKGKRVIQHASKAAAVVSQSTQAQAGPLIDLNGEYVRYEIVFNEVMYNYIVDNDLYNLAGIASLGKIDFPSSSLSSDAQGSIEVKAAWKVMGKGDDASRFHVTNAFVFDELGDQCAVETLALVGLHIASKTESAPQWIWSTFEHADNAPGQGQMATKGHYSFYNPDCATGEQRCTPNQLPPLPWDPSIPDQTPVQVVREDPVASETSAVNAHFQSVLREANPDTVWANYFLVGTQYPQQPKSKTDPQGRPFPPYLANTTMETFLQGRVPTVSSSCIACHGRATAANSGKPTDFTYLLSRVTAKN